MLAHKCHKNDIPLIMIGIESLEFSSQYYDLLWLSNLLNLNYCPEILSSIPLNFPNILIEYLYSLINIICHYHWVSTKV